MIFYLTWFYIKYFKKCVKAWYSIQPYEDFISPSAFVFGIIITDITLVIQPTEIGMTVNIGFIKHFNAVFDKFRYVLGFFGQQNHYQN